MSQEQREINIEIIGDLCHILSQYYNILPGNHQTGDKVPIEQATKAITLIRVSEGLDTMTRLNWVHIMNCIVKIVHHNYMKVYIV